MREFVLTAYLAFGCMLFISTEFLSFLRLFSFFPLCLFWILALLLLAALFFKGKIPHPPWKSLSPPPLTMTEQFLLKYLALLTLVLGLLAVYMPPDTWDAMTYHMSRVMHWIQNQTVAAYPTHIQRQLMYNAFAEYWIAQFQILSGGDRWANLVQWLSMVGSLIGISLIAKAIGLERLAQILCAFFVLTLPNAIVQSTSTQTDFVTTLWTVTAVYFILKNIQKLSWDNSCAIALSGGLAVCTKGTAYYILLPFLAWMTWHALKARRAVAPHAALIVLTLGSACALFLMRNHAAMDAWIYQDTGNKILPMASVQGILSDFLLHLFMHLKTGIVFLDHKMMGLLEALHHAMGTSIAASPANNEGFKFNYDDRIFFEDLVPNFLFTVFLLFGAVPFLWSAWKQQPLVRRTFYLLSLFCLLVFDVCVRWSPFDGRFQLPFFVLLAPLLAEAAAEKKFLGAIIALFVAAAVPFVLFNASKPIVSKASILKFPRTMRYFYNDPFVLDPVKAASEAVLNSGCRSLGLDIGEDTWEYPWWVFLHQQIRPVRIEHVLVNNPSSRLAYPLGSFSPCAIASIQNTQSLSFQGSLYERTRPFGTFSLYALHPKN